MTLEFDRIARHFAPLAGPEGLDLRDDAAVLDGTPGQRLVLTSDAIVAGIHFLPDDPPELVARKVLRVNLSDIAAMGARPRVYLLTVSVPADTPEAWFEGFAAGLRTDQAIFGVSLVGGDSTSTPGPVTVGVTMLGEVAPDAVLRRNGGRAGDALYVTGVIGAGALGLLASRGELPDPGGALRQRYTLPEPRLGLRLAGIVSAAMDVSDGLVQDCGHLCAASGVGAVIEAGRVPVPEAGRGRLALCLTGGDDYELLLAVPPDREAALEAACGAGGVTVTRIGGLAAGSGVRVLDDTGAEMRLQRGGWSHF